MNNLFWNVEKNSKIDKVTLVERSFKYGDFDDIKRIFQKFDKNEIKDIWLKTMAWDKRYIKINLLIARVFLDMDVESDYFLRLKSGRFEDKVSAK